MEEVKKSWKEKSQEWFKEYQNWIFAALLVLGIIIRLKYLNINTGVWWDELEYLATGKSYAGLLSYPLAPERAFFFPLLISFIFRLGLGDIWVKILLEFLPSVGILIGTYLLGKHFFNKKVGLLAMAIFLIFPENLFDGARFLSDMLANFFELFTILLFYILYVKGKKPSLLWVVVVLGILGFFTRYTACLSLIAVAIYLIATKRLSLFKDKNILIAIGAGIVMFILYIVYNLATFHAPLPAITHYLTDTTTGAANIAASYGFVNSSFFTSVLSWFSLPLLIFLIIGLYAFVEFFLVFDKSLKEDNPQLLFFLWIIISALFWIFIFHYTTSRWALGLAPALFIIASKGVIYSQQILSLVLSFITANKKTIIIISSILVLILFAYGLKQQYSFADSLIKSRADSYAPVKDISLWLKDNTNSSDFIIYDERIWYTYYVGRNNSLMTSLSILPENYNYKNMSYLLKDFSYGYVPMCEYDFDFTLNRLRPNYLVWTIYDSVYSPTPEYLQKNVDLGIFVPIKTWTANQQISAAVFRIDYFKLQTKLAGDYSNQILPAAYAPDVVQNWNEYKQKTGITEKSICGFNGQFR